ncbi:MAG: hypothetical protein M3Z41_02195 [Candidatus Eremiobacteraeota bacterium]|nr:hypothetical protein [Candidatus Eremiobacteraeota bacterium]
MKTKVWLAASLVAALLVSLAPAPRALADGAASTRNILMGIGAAAGTLIIINHNKKVHQKYAEDAQKQAATAAQRDDARAAYRSEVRAYENQVAVTSELKREVAVKDRMIEQQKLALQQQNQQLAQLGIQVQQQQQPVAAPVKPARKPAPAPVLNHSAQMLAYGWGTF